MSRPGIWRVLDQPAAAQGVALVCVQPLLVARAREAEDFTRNKNDDIRLDDHCPG